MALEVLERVHCGSRDSDKLLGLDFVVLRALGNE